MIVAVTGANGFIGRHLCARLARDGHEVRMVVRRDFERGDLRERFSRADVVIHAAAATRAPTHDALNRSNVGLTERVAGTCRELGTRRLVLVSSQAAAGPAAALNQPVREDDEPSPVEAYGRSKLAAEEIVRSSGVPFAIVRPAAVYGRGDRDFAAVFSLARRGIAIHPGNREQWISIIHVHDCVEGIMRTVQTDGASSRTYFLANDEPVQWSTFYDLTARAFGRRRVLDVQLPRLLVAAGARLGDAAARISGRASLLTSEKVALSRPRFWICSNARARRELGFAPRLSLSEGLAAIARPDV